MDIFIRKGETLELNIKADDNTAETVQFLVAQDDGTVLINETANFTTEDEVTSATIRTNDTNHPLGSYDYQFTITYSDDFIEILPDSSACTGDCELPKLTICEAIDVSSGD